MQRSLTVIGHRELSIPFFQYRDAWRNSEQKNMILSLYFAQPLYLCDER